ncbi:glycosyltransferase family 4 protein [Leptolyngbya sp. FACHB-321]|uniref:glycosyltransferase family 4 protein n=1 Tax=Leptolyngbya sp. FACHB-321 TaxID=2692807 RepID=UPI001685C336|nr:glycosyltransferase family 4 protein [Leptolyngbya sp. FACHB-321]MBD2037927.1 glycosyltransferase family 4 protein [Leptolyngbya sp. FACHB-321]
MNVLLLSTSDINGGAARAAYRLHRGLKRINASTQMMVQIKSSDDDAVIAPRPNLRRDFAKARPALNALPLKLYPHHGSGTFSTQWLPDYISPKVRQITPDIVNIHWACDGFLQIETLAKLNCPLVWTLHDMWAFTGGCHYSQECDRYTASCGSCPQLGSNRNFDLSRWILKRKAKAWKNLNLSIVTPSHWLAECARSSSLFHALPVHVIPYGIDLERYRSADRKFARHILKLPQDKQLILFTAIGATSDRRKGLHLLQAALQYLEQIGCAQQIELLIVGASQPDTHVDLKLRMHYLGTLSDDISLSLAYAAADIFVAPSTQDNLPNTVIEALACGTPCVAFNIGGMPDLIDHQQNGYLAQPFQTEDLAHGITWVLSNEKRHQCLADAARQKAEREFALEKQATRYVDLFKQILNSSFQALP